MRTGDVGLQRMWSAQSHQSGYLQNRNSNRWSAGKMERQDTFSDYACSG